MNAGSTFPIPTVFKISEGRAMSTSESCRQIKVREAVQCRCKFLRLGTPETDTCISHAAKLLRRQRSAAEAIRQGIGIAKAIARRRDNSKSDSE